MDRQHTRSLVFWSYVLTLRSLKVSGSACDHKKWIIRLLCMKNIEEAWTRCQFHLQYNGLPIAFEQTITSSTELLLLFISPNCTIVGEKGTLVSLICWKLTSFYNGVTDSHKLLVGLRHHHSPDSVLKLSHKMIEMIKWPRTFQSARFWGFRPSSLRW